MADGVSVRELPDGGHEFLLEDPVLAAIVIGRRAVLRFGRSEVAVSGPFRLEVDGVEHRPDTRQPDSLTPLLSCYPGSAHWLWASPTGELNLVMMQGQRMVVPAPVVHRTWSVSGSQVSGAEPARG